MRPVPPQATALCKASEGLRLKAYPDPASGGDPWTIGYGSTGPDIKPGMTCTPEEAEQRLNRGLAGSVGSAIRCSPALAVASDLRLAAIADFIYNLGATRYKGSTLRKRVNAQEWTRAAQEIVKWNKGGGRVMPGLVIRRAAEAALLR